MNFTKIPMFRWAAMLSLGALLLTSAPASAKSKGHGGKSHKKWQKQERKEAKRWEKQERKEARRWEKENRNDWDDDREWSDRDRYGDRSSRSGDDWWRQYFSQGVRR